MGSKVYWNCLIGSMAEQISILHMEVNFQFDGIPLSVHFAPPLPFAPPKKGMHPPNRRCTPLSALVNKNWTQKSKNWTLKNIWRTTLMKACTSGPPPLDRT